MPAIRGSYGCGIVARHVRMKYPYVKKCVLTSIPETSCVNIKASIRVRIGRTIGEGLTIKLLKSWLGGNVVANFSKKCCSNVTNFVVANCWNFPHVAFYCMVDKERVTQLRDSGVLYRIHL